MFCENCVSEKEEFGKEDDETRVRPPETCCGPMRLKAGVGSKMLDEFFQHGDELRSFFVG